MTPTQFKKFSETMDLLVKAVEEISNSLKAKEEIKPLQNVTSSIINVDGPPKIPYDGWTVEEHTDLGDVDLSKLELYLDPAQETGWIEGDDLIKKLKGKRLLNVNVKNYLMAHQELIPESWKEKTPEGYTKFIYFWGTIFRSGQYRYVEYVFFLGAAWRESYGYLVLHWHVNRPAAHAKL